MPEPMVDKSVDDSLAAEAEKLLAQDAHASGDGVPAAVAAEEAEADLSADVERLMRDAAPVADADGAAGSLDMDLASLTESLLSEDAGEAAEAMAAQDAAEAEAKESSLAADAGAALAEAQAKLEAPKTDAGSTPETNTTVAPSDGQAAGAEAAPAEASAATPAETSAATVAEPTRTDERPNEAAMNAELDAAAAEVEIPPAPEPPLPPAEAVGKAAAESIAASEAKKKGKSAKSEPRAAKQVAGATLEDLKPSVVSKIFAPLTMIGGLVVTVCAMISKPLAKRPAVVRDSIGWLSVSTLFCGVSLWGYALVFRKPPEPPMPKEPVALVETAGGPETTYAKRSGAAAAGHGEAKKDAKKDAGHGEAKKAEPKKGEAKKPDAKKSEHGEAKKSEAPKAEAKKTEAKKSEGH